MRFDVLDQLRQPGGRAVCEIDGAPPEGLATTRAGSVRGRIELTNVGRDIMARGEVTATVELECTRCLRSFQQTVVAEIQEPCTLAELDAVASYSVAMDEPETLPILEDKLINLSGLVRQNLIVALPHRPLCAPDCRGLCAQCGKDLNQGPCDCHEEEVDPRLAPLKAILAEHAALSTEPDSVIVRPRGGRHQKG